MGALWEMIYETLLLSKFNRHTRHSKIQFLKDVFKVSGAITALGSSGLPTPRLKKKLE